MVDNEGIDWGEFASVLTEASGDLQLLNFGLWMSGWRNAFGRLSLSRGAVRLTELLESPQFAMLNDRPFYHGNGGSTVNVGYLAKWLARRASQVGADDAIAGLRRLVDTGEKPELDILLLTGIRVEREYNVDGRFKLVPIQEIWKYSIDHFNDYLYHLRDSFGSVIPSAALVTVRQVPTSTEPAREDIDRRIIDYAAQDLFWLVLGLVCPGEAPTPIGRWILLPSWVPFSGLLDSGFSSRLEIKHPKGEASLGDSEVEHAIKLYGILKNLPSSVSKPLGISLNRLNQSVNTWDMVQQAIDLGVALEAVLTPSESTDQLSFQFRLLGALLVGDTQAERLEAFDIFKAFYTLRSKAVHNGELPTKGFSVFGRSSKLSPGDILLEATRLGRLAVVRLIERGGLSPEDYPGYLLSAGGRCAD